MNAGTFQNYNNRNQKKPDRAKEDKRAKQTKERVAQSMQAKTQEFIDVARQINELYTAFVATGDVFGFGQAVLERVAKSHYVFGQISEIQAIIDGYSHSLCLPDEPKGEPSCLDLECAKQRLEAMNRALQDLLRRAR